MSRLHVTVWVRAAHGLWAYTVLPTAGSVIYERFYLRFTDAEKSDIRAAFQRASEGVAPGAPEESELADKYK